MAARSWHAGFPASAPRIGPCPTEDQVVRYAAVDGRSVAWASVGSRSSPRRRGLVVEPPRPRLEGQPVPPFHRRARSGAPGDPLRPARVRALRQVRPVAGLPRGRGGRPRRTRRRHRPGVAVVVRRQLGCGRRRGVRRGAAVPRGSARALRRLRPRRRHRPARRSRRHRRRRTTPLGPRVPRAGRPLHAGRLGSRASRLRAVPATRPRHPSRPRPSSRWSTGSMRATCSRWSRRPRWCCTAATTGRSRSPWARTSLPRSGERGSWSSNGDEHFPWRGDADAREPRHDPLPRRDTHPGRRPHPRTSRRATSSRPVRPRCSGSSRPVGRTRRSLATWCSAPTRSTGTCRTSGRSSGSPPGLPQPRGQRNATSL